MFFPEINVISGFSAVFQLWIILWHRFLQPLVDTDGSTGTTLDRSMETWELEAMNLVRSRVNGQVCKKGIDPLAVCLGECNDIVKST